MIGGRPTSGAAATPLILAFRAAIAEVTAAFSAFLAGTEIEEDMEALDETTIEALKEVIKTNPSLDELRTSLEGNFDLNESQRKMVFRFWKTHGAAMMRLIQKPVSHSV